ncbi:MAG TPA: Hsp70 family protein, partial [Kofleriaceae bacterium]|nr:Hsp70 family protein [Kofleriaceae bacterium]
YDFGGGTFDITILKLEDQVYEVLGTAGDTFLGGDDLDERIVDKMVDRFLADNRIDLRTNEVSMMRLRAVAEQTKIELSRRSRAVVRIDEIAYGPRGAPLNLQIEVTRDEFVSQVADLIDKTFPTCQEAMQLAGLGIDRINDVILVGGTTKIPYVRDQVTKFFAKTPRTDVNPEDAVAVGAALQATSLERILARPTRQSNKIATIQEEDTVSSFANPIGNDDITKKDPDHERAKRSTSGYDKRAPEQPRPTEYSLTRTQTIDRFEEREKPATRPPPVAIPPPQPLGRLTKSSPVVAPPPTPPPSPIQAKTMFGVPAGPVMTPPPSDAFDPAEESTDTNTGVRVRPEERPATPPPIPARPASAQRPAVNPATTQPMAPLAPIAPPTAPTMVAIDLPAASSTARGMGKQALEIDLPPATTAKGFQAPQTYPVMPVKPVTFAPPVTPTPPVAFQAAPAPPPVIIEVTPRSLGIGTVAGFCEELIRRNSKVPTETRKLFTTSRDSQDSVRIVVVQGESRRLDNNVVIGDLRLDNLPPRPRGETSIEVTFALDPSGILQVRARDAQTGKEQRAQLDIVGNVPAQDVAGSRDRIAALRR